MRAKGGDDMNAIMPKMQISMGFDWHVDVVAYVSRGVSISGACAAAGVSRATYYRHRQKYPHFKRQIDRAQVIAEIELFRAVKSSGDWRAWMRLMEKRYPRSWGTIKDRLRLHGCTCGAAKYIDPPTWGELYKSWKACQW